MESEQGISFQLVENDYVPLLCAMHLSFFTAKSETDFGKQIRLHHLLDPAAIEFLSDMFTNNDKKNPFIITQHHLQNIVSACDITRKLFLSDDLEKIKTEAGFKPIPEIARNNTIRFCDFFIKQVGNNEQMKPFITDLLFALEKDLKP
jgi:hypothetical protein